jgi:hypothetical protein
VSKATVPILFVCQLLEDRYHQGKMGIQKEESLKNLDSIQNFQKNGISNFQGKNFSTSTETI